MSKHMESSKQKIARLTAVAALALLFFSDASAALASEITPGRMLELTNQSRMEAGLSPLTASDKLSLAARDKADDMFQHQYFEHTSPDGITPWHWFDLVGYDYVYAAENLAVDFSTAEGVHSALMKSTGHRENILCVNYEEIGIAVESGTFRGKQSTIVVEEFGAARQPKVIKLSDDFYEEPSPETKSVPAAKTAVQPVTKKPSVEVAKPQTDKPVAQPQETTSVAPKPTPASSPEPLSAPIKERISESASSSLGKVVPQIFAVKDARTLKKVYVENIYWEKANGHELSYSLQNGGAILKALLRDLESELVLSLIR